MLMIGLAVGFMSFDISSSGIAANKKRVEAISSNIANAHTTRSPEGGPYRPKEVVFGSEPVRERFSEVADDEIGESMQTVHAMEVVSTNKPPILKYEPNHPDANAQGYVAYPDINPMVEQINLMEAHRAYEANIKAFNTTKHMYMKALEIGR